MATRKMVVFLLMRCVFLFGLGTFLLQAQVIYRTPRFHPRYEPVAVFPGEIQDITPREVLYVTSDRQLMSFDPAARGSHVVRTNFSGRARKIPNGYLLWTDYVEGKGNRMLQVQGNEEIEVGFEMPVIRPDKGDRVLEGAYGLFDMAEGTMFRDFVARTNFFFPTNVTLWHRDVAANGAVLFSAREAGETNNAWSVHRFHDGNFEQLAIVEGMPHVATDGTNFLWTGQQEARSGTIYLQTPGERIILATNTFVLADTVITTSPLPPPASLFAMNGGWVAFPRFNPERPVSGFYDIWRRSPEGMITRAVEAPAYVTAIRADGALLVMGSERGELQTSIRFVPANGPAKYVSHDFGARYFVSGDDFYALSATPAGMTLFRIDLSGEPFAFQDAYYDRDRGLLVYGMVATAPGDYVLERTTDFSAWTAVSTNSIANAPFPMSFEAVTVPGVFRLRRLKS